MFSGEFPVSHKIRENDVEKQSFLKSNRNRAFFSIYTLRFMSI